MLLLKCMQCLKAYVQLSWLIKLGKISEQELWIGHGRGKGFLGNKTSKQSNNLLSIHFAIFVSPKVSTYKLDLLGHLNLCDNTTSHVVCEGASVTDAEGVWA